MHEEDGHHKCSNNCHHDPKTWNFNQVRGHDPRTGYVTFFLEVVCPACESRREAIRIYRYPHRRVAL